MRRHLHQPTANDGKLIDIFFWGTTKDSKPDPRDFVKENKEAVHRLALAGVLMNGETIASYRGIAMCRMPNCKVGLGSSDLAAFGYRFPQGCEHYVLMHNVWVPGCDELLGLAIKEVRNAR